MNEKLHLDIFSGLGAWTIASAMLGIKTIAFCETDERCKSFLGRAWPGIPVFPDVRKLDGRQFRGVDLLTASTPCQPASRGGYQRGSSDERWLWPEVIRLVREAKPRVVICENPPGIGDVGLCGILAELEAEGYEIAPLFDIPACALNSPQLRHRYYIVAYAQSPGQPESGTDRIGGGGPEGASCEPVNGHAHESDVANTNSRHGEFGKGEPQRGSQGRDVDRGIGAHHLANATESGLRQGCADGGRQPEGMGENGHGQRSTYDDFVHGFWDNYLWLPCADGKVRRAPCCPVCVAPGLSSELPKELGQAQEQDCENLIEAHRSLIGALGNSQVPQIAYMIIKAAMEALNT
jgi:site-specific DNA-cytosine methylase